jgi:serine/threonine protein kinase
VDDACDRFEAAWKAGQRPAIEDYVACAAEPERAALLHALLALEIELRGKTGDRPALDDYAKRFPDQGELLRAIFAEAQAVNFDSGRAEEPSTGPRIPPDDSSGGEVNTPVPAESPSPLPDRIGRYKVCGELGRGTFGKVYLAQDDLMERQVAIKVPSPRLLASRRARELFLSEARSAGRLQHAGIVRAYDFGQAADGTFFIVYELIKGTSLKERIKPERLAAEPLAPAEAARIVAQLAEALHHAHLEGLVHRDVKPANVLLDLQETPRLTDLGLAVREEDLPNERGRLAGTLPYMSPEQVRREGHHIDGRTDIYSLGVVLYELLCGRRPFEAKTVEELEDQILHREAKPPRQIRDAIPPQLEQVCLRALAKPVYDRYPTAKDMAAELWQALASMTGDGSPTVEVSPAEVERRLTSGDEEALQQVLRLLRQAPDPVFLPQIFRCLGYPSEAVRQQARKAVHTLGWDKVSDAAADLARRDPAAGIPAVLDGLAAFEAHPQIVGLLDRLLVLLKGDLRTRAILLLERKRLGLELEAVAGLFRDIHSPYCIAKALGQGLFAASYLAHADGTDLAVVVRVLRPELVGQPELRAQFLDLNQKALKVVHENVVLTREARAFPERNTYFAVRDYVDGVTLQKLLQGGKRFQPGQILRLLRLLLAALGAVHRCGMCHGGVKPSNVFVGAEDRVVLGDPTLPVQGIGVALERLSYDYRYAAPETFRGGEVVGPPADFYSLGCVAYELACGEPPFVADNYLELAARHLHEAVVPPSRRGSGLGPAGDEVLLKLLARSGTDRYARADDVLCALDGLEASWRPPTAGVRPPALPLVRDTSLARFRSAESVLDLDASVPSLVSRPSEMPAAGSAPPPEGREQPNQVPDAEGLGQPGSEGRSRPVPKVIDFGLSDGGEAVDSSLPRTASGALEEPASPAQAPPSRVGDYEILEELGRGGMGVVYKALDRRLERVVALKTLRASVVERGQRLVRGLPDPELARFIREARAVAQLQHPHIVQVYDIGDYEGLAYVALEFVSGRSLAEKLRQEPLTPRAAAAIVAQLANTLHYAHEKGILHRDLKPSNVMLTPDGQPKITDFGLAKMQARPEEAASITHSGMILGTPSYMSPEQAGGQWDRVGPATDIYGLGAIFYEALTGRPPFRGASAYETLSKLATEQVAAPDTLNPAVEFDLSSICLKCLQKDPQRRYPSAKALAEDLERWLAGQPIQARPATKLTRFLRWCRRSLAGLLTLRKRA